jgi:hypothetical protein
MHKHIIRKSLFVNQRRIIVKRQVAVAAVLLLILISGMSGSEAFSADPIKVGIIDCYTGPPSTYTNDVRDAFKLAVDKINATGVYWAERLNSRHGIPGSRSIWASAPPKS